jgi:hypothetical protein
MISSLANFLQKSFFISELIAYLCYINNNKKIEEHEVSRRIATN